MLFLSLPSLTLISYANIGFHVTPKLASICPESVVLMILGVLIGILLFYGGIDRPPNGGRPGDNETPSFQQPLTPNIFFLYMLPPIVMDAGYHMPNRLFFDNLMSILMYAVLGTIWNALTIGFCLYFCAQTGMFGVEIPLLDTLLFSSIVSAVDPVAVLAVFEEIHVNEVLYILVFGESLLNDAVTVVLYHMFEGYTEMGVENILPVDFVAGFASFFVISLGGTLMGVLWGFAAAFVSRFTHHVKIIEPIFVFVMAYLSYLSAEMFHLSGILALTFCGITMKNYVEENITETSQTTLKYAMKMLANSSESVIFLFLGVCTVTDTHDWNTLFVVLTIAFALIFRALGVILFTAIANRFRLHKLTGIEQFIMSYGGLRGAVAFALVLVVNEHIIPTKKMMVTTIIAIVYFTVFLQGMTIGPLVKILKVPRAKKFEMSMNERINSRLMDHVMAGIEDISGMMIGNYKVRDKFRHFNNLYLKHWFLRDSHERGNSSRKIFETYSRLNLQDALNAIKQANTFGANGSNGNNNNLNLPGGGGGQEKSLSSLLRTYTEAQLRTSATKEIDRKGDSPGVDPSLPPSFTSICMETIPYQPGVTGGTINAAFNFDLANLGYSPSHRDLAEAEIHHILSDNLFKPVRRYKHYSKCDLPENNGKDQMQHLARHQIRTMMSQNIKKRRRQEAERKTKQLDKLREFPHNVYLSDAHRHHLHEDHETTSGERPASSGDEDIGITFEVPSSQTQTDEPKTAVEAILPWRRNSSFGNPTDDPSKTGSGDEEGSMVLRQEEFPPWIGNKDYLPQYASPTNTMLEALDRDRNSSQSRIPPVFEIFHQQEPSNRSRTSSRTGQHQEEGKESNLQSKSAAGKTSKQRLSSSPSPRQPPIGEERREERARLPKSSRQDSEQGRREASPAKGQKIPPFSSSRRVHHHPSHKVNPAFLHDDDDHDDTSDHTPVTKL